MSEFQEGTVLKKPDELTKKRFINPNNQMNKNTVRELAEKHSVIWGAK